MGNLESSLASPGHLGEGYKPLFGTLEKILKNSDYSDLQITCGDCQWSVHKNIVCTQSDFFKACSKNFKEADEGIIKLPDDNKHAVDALIRYLYTADYDDELAVEEFAPIVFSVHVNTIADKYNINGLAELAAAKVAKRATNEWNTPAFADAIEELYETSHESKKEVQQYLVDVAAEHIKELRSEAFGMRFREVSDAIAPFSAALLSRVVDAEPKPSPFDDLKIYRCPACSKKVFIETTTTNGYTYHNCNHCGHCRFAENWQEWKSN